MKSLSDRRWDSPRRSVPCSHEPVCEFLMTISDENSRKVVFFPLSTFFGCGGRKDRGIGITPQGRRRLPRSPCLRLPPSGKM
jgi:hypothetical protein